MVDIIVQAPPQAKVASSNATAQFVNSPQQIIVIPQSLLSQATTLAENNLHKKPILRVSPSMNSNQTKINLKRPLPPQSPQKKSPVVKQQDEDDSSAAPPRKRANLDHLSPEEKLMRRKLKNRVAAQNARDKKRAKIDDMEELIAQLKEENLALQRQNERLTELNKRLTSSSNTPDDSSMPPSPVSLPRSPLPPSPALSTTSSDQDRTFVVSPSSESAERSGWREGRGQGQQTAGGGISGHGGLLSSLDLSGGAAATATSLTTPLSIQIGNGSVGGSDHNVIVSPVEEEELVHQSPSISGQSTTDLEEYLVASPPLEVEGLLKMQHSDDDLDQQVASNSDCEQILDKLLNASNASQLGLQEQVGWEESFNELFPDLI